jgi:hypothetical protein
LDQVCSAQLAYILGLPYAFASISLYGVDPALQAYRRESAMCNLSDRGGGRGMCSRQRLRKRDGYLLRTELY